MKDPDSAVNVKVGIDKVLAIEIIITWIRNGNKSDRNNNYSIQQSNKK